MKNKKQQIDFNNLQEDDKIAMAEAYRAYEILDYDDREKIPSDFVETILKYGNLLAVKPFASKEEFENYNFSIKGKYLLMYLCTFENVANDYE